jgi:hypothetical protein
VNLDFDPPPIRSTVEEVEPEIGVSGKQSTKKDISNFDGTCEHAPEPQIIMALDYGATYTGQVLRATRIMRRLINLCRCSLGRNHR